MGSTSLFSGASPSKEKEEEETTQDSVVCQKGKFMLPIETFLSADAP